MSGCAAPSISPIDFEEMNRHALERRIPSRQQLFRRHPNFMSTGPAGRRGTANSRNACATRCRPKCSPRPTRIRSAAIRKRRATICAKRTRLLKEAGFEVRDRKLVDPAGQPVSVEFLMPGSGRRAESSLFYKPSLERLGITVNIRTVDRRAVPEPRCAVSISTSSPTVWRTVAVAGQRAARFFRVASGGPARLAQYSRHQESRGRCADRAHHLRQGSRRTGRAAARRWIGCLLWNFYVVPQFTYGFQRYARWDRFSHPEPLPKYGVSGFPGAVVVRRRQGGQDG